MTEASGDAGTRLTTDPVGKARLIHPVVALAWVVLVAGFLARGEWRDIAVVASGCGGLLAVSRSLSVGALLRTLRRLRFFYLSLGILYLWFSPGEPVWPALGGLSPSYYGVAEALRHVAILALIVTTVQLFVMATPRDVLVAALHWWLRPVDRLGGDALRIAMRINLVIDIVPRLRDLARRHGGRADHDGRRSLRRLASRAAGVFVATVHEAEHAALPLIEVARLPSPSAAQWLPVALTVTALTLL